MSRESQAGARWADLELEARALLQRPSSEWTETLRQLARDPRFAAVVALLMQLEDEWKQSISAQGMAACHGKLAHAAGSMYGMTLLLHRIRLLLVAGESQERQPD